MSQPIPPVIHAVGINKVFTVRNADPVVALTDVTLDIHPGEFISLIGPSGCGKSTLLRLIADLAEPTSGELTVNGKKPAQARLDRDYGMVFQAATLYDWRNVTQNVQLPLEIMGTPKAEREKRAQEMLELVELGKFGRHYPWQLSGGMQQRVAIARALAFQPKLLLMDEPTNHLDLGLSAFMPSPSSTSFVLSETIDALIIAINNFSGGILAVSHDQHFLNSVCTDFWGVGAGKVSPFRFLLRSIICRTECPSPEGLS